MEASILLVLLLLLFVVAVLGFGSKGNKRGLFLPKGKNIFSRNGHDRKEFWREAYNAEKGAAGERAVSRILSCLPQSEYRVFNDVLLNNPFGGTTQIDHIVVSQFGVFVIETKNFGGKVYGGTKAMFWKEYFRGKEYKFYNPVQQNNTHIAVLRENLASFVNIPFFSLVAFPPNAILRVSVNNGTQVLCWDDLLEVFWQHKDGRMTPNKAKAFGFELNRVQIKEPDGHQRHIEFVQKKKMAIQDGICPYCGSKLVRRKGKFGDFFGCSTYPNCNFIRKVDD